MSMSATVRDIGAVKLAALARYLDGFPPLLHGQKEEHVDQYYSLLCGELRRLPPPLGEQFTYTRSELTEFGMATLTDDQSPSLLLLQDLQRRGLPLREFISSLEKIGCQKALNEFIAATRPEITQQPQSVRVFEGEGVRLVCQARCRPGQPTFFWFKRRDSERPWEPVINSSGNILEMKEANTADGGGYSCRATNPRINDQQKASVFTEEVTVKVECREIQQNTPIRQETVRDLAEPPAFPPVILTPPQSLTVDYGQPSHLDCSARGENITYDWFRDGTYVRTQSKTGRIEFARTKLEHAGKYQCKMTNPQNGSVMSDVVTLTVVPVIVIDEQPPKSVHGYKNDKIRLECSAHSRRGPVTYQWLRNRKAISGATSRVFEDTLRAKLSGALQCQVGLRDDTDQLPMLSTTTKVTVDTIKIVYQPDDVQGETGESVSLYCMATVIPPSTNTHRIEYIWLKSNSKGGKKEPIQKALQPQLCDGMLLFEQLKIDHDGHYICQACLRKEFVGSVEVRLTVKMAGTPSPAAVSIVRQPVSWVVREGGSFKMRCRAEVVPNQPLLYQWVKNSTPIPNETAPELIRENVCGSDYVTYQCEVKTEAGGVLCRSDSAYTYPAPSDPPAAKGPASHDYTEAEQNLVTLSNQRYARGKVALLIGNQRYSDCPKLNNLKCIEDEVRQVAEKLRQLDFKVFVFVNLRLSEMKEVLTWFYTLLSPGVYGLFYYSGHGFQAGSTSYLMPTDLQSPEPVTANCVGSGSIAHEMQRTLCRAVLVLDCCRLIQDSDKESLQAETPYQSLGIANLMEIHSTTRGVEAFDGSAFTPSFIEALDTNEDIATLYADISERMRKKGDKATPWNNASMGRGISLRDPIMRDSMKREEEAERICDLADSTNIVCGAVVVEGHKLGSMAKLLSLRLSYRTTFTNVLSVKVVANPKKINVSPSIEMKKDSLMSQGVECETESNTLSLEVTIRHLQRLKEPLCLPVVVSVPGSEEMRQEVRHTLSGPTLASLINFN